MMTRLALIVITLVAVKLRNVNADFYREFAGNTSFDNNVCSEDGILFDYSFPMSGIYSRCLWTCKRNPACMSVFVNNETGQCTGCKLAFFSTDTLNEETGTKYFRLKTKLYGQKCYPGDVCIGINETCSTDTCICQIGYSYDYKTQTCVDYCVTYGTSFQKYPGQRLFQLNDKGNLRGLTLNECKQRCISVNTCRSLDYKQSLSACLLSTATALSHPSALDAENSYDYYSRNCEE